VAHDRGLNLNVAAAVKACEEFADRDLAREVGKFRHYYLDGDGQNRRMKDVVGAWRSWLENAPPAGPAKVTKAPAKNRSKYSRVERAEASA
jgi:hypothetical protein